MREREHGSKNVYRKKSVFLFLSISFIFTLAVTQAHYYISNTLQATTSNFHMFEKVKLKDQTYTIIDNSGTLKLLSDTVIADNQTYADATSQVNNHHSQFGALGSVVLKDHFSLATADDLSAVTTDQQLSPSIPTITNDWWLGDEPVEKKAKFVSSDNRLDKEVKFKRYYPKTNYNDGGVRVSCPQTETSEQGILPSESISDDEEPITINEGLGTNIHGAVTTNSAIYTADTIGISTSKNATCASALNGSILKFKDMGDRGGFAPDDPNTFYGGTQNWDFLYDYLFLNQNEALRTPGTSRSMTFEIGKCYPIKRNNYSYRWDAKSWMIQHESKDISHHGKTVTITVKIDDVVNLEKTCTLGIPRDAGTISIRPLSILNQNEIVYAGENERNFSPSSISKTFPDVASGDKNFLTLQTNQINIGLATGQPGVENSTTFSTFLPKDKIIDLPVTLTGPKELTTYVSASAMVDGVKTYGILKEVSSTSDTISIDLNDLSSDIESLNKIEFTLYKEDRGSDNISYMSEGTPITINFKESQEIAFTDTSTLTTEYGTNVNVESKLVSELSDQANTNIEYSIVSGPALVKNSSYDSVTGIATAEIQPTSGTGTVVIAINKAGNDMVGAAKEKTITLNLTKKSMVIKPKKFTRIYGVGETMPELLSESSDLVYEDVLPSEITIELLNSDNSFTKPNEDTKIANVGVWKLTYPSNTMSKLPLDFKNKYDVTLQDWNQDQTLVFETGANAIPEGWIIIAPEANDEGWHKDTVTISLSDEAKASGYIIEVVNDAGTVLNSGVTLTYDTETSGTEIRVRLKKQDFTTDSNVLTTLKIDKTNPTASISVSDETQWAKKKTIKISAEDARSGIAKVTIKGDGLAEQILTLKDGLYSYDVNKEGTYTITVTDVAGNTITQTKEVTKIDLSSVSLTATKEPLSTTQPKQKIELSFDAGDSGIKTFKVYHKEAGGRYTFLADLDATSSPYDYEAEMNGFYKFELINNTGDQATDEVEITMVKQPNPVTKIEATYLDDTSIAYTSNTWTNHDILLTFSNTNTEISDPVVWEYSENNGTTWKGVSDNTLEIKTTNTVEKTILVRGKVNKAGGNDIVEQTNKSIAVKIDKTKPAAPTVKQAEDYTQANWYSEPVTLETEVTEKPTKLKQEVYVCLGTSSECTGNDATWTKAINGKKQFNQNGSYEVYFKVIDEAGNESNLSRAVYVNINDTEPIITIKVKNNPLKSMINSLTFGFFFSETVDVDIEADFGDGQDGTIYYYIDLDGSGQPKAATWTQGNHTSLSPQTKAMIYAKAVSDAGVEVTESSIFHVYVDTIKPTIEFDNLSTTWTKDNTLTLNIEDDNSGVDDQSVAYQIGSSAEVKLILNKGKTTIKNLKDGSYQISIKAKDHSGNAMSEIVNVKIDTVKPIIKKPVEVSEAWAKEKRIQIEISDALSGIKEVIIKDKDGTPVSVSDKGNNLYEFKTNKAGVYTIKAIDLAGNETVITYEVGAADTTPPTIIGVQDQKQYKQYYLPRKFKVEDLGSGVKEAHYTKDGGTSIDIDFVNGTKIKGEGVYEVYAEDNAGNTISLTFKIVKLPEIETEIDGSDESKVIIDQVEKELNESREYLDPDEIADVEQWIENAKKKWNESRIKELEDDQTKTKVEGQGETSFDPSTKLYVEELDEQKIPTLPKRAIAVYDVYMKKGDTVVQPDGKVKVYLPYTEEAEPIVYEIGEDGSVKEILAVKKDGYVVFTTDRLKKYAISNTAQEDTKPTPNPKPDDGKNDHICVVGPDSKSDTSDDVCGSEDSTKNPDGSVDVPSGGTIHFPNKDLTVPDGAHINPDGSVVLPDGTEYNPDGTKKEPKPEEPKACPTEGKEINVDTNKDGKPDLNIDTDGDCKADLNIDTDDDGIPDVNIDTTLDGKPDYNIDLNNDGKPDVNIGPVNDPWKPSVCKTVGKLEYCSDPYKKPYLNVDTDGDGRPDLNLDLDGDLEADLNIDVDGDNIPDVNIDTTGNGKPDINIDIDNDGEADENLLKLTKWEPNKDVDGKIKYDTMTGLVPDPALNKNPNGGSSNSGTDAGGVNSSTKVNGTYSNVNTGDIAKTSFWWILVLINGCVTGYLMHRRKQKR